MLEGAVKLGMSLDEIIDKTMGGKRTGRKSTVTEMQIDRKGSGVRKHATWGGGSGRQGSREPRQKRKPVDRRGASVCLCSCTVWIKSTCLLWPCRLHNLLRDSAGRNLLLHPP